MIIDMAVLGAIGIAGGALSAGNHLLTARKVRKMKEDLQFKTVEITVLEIGLTGTIVLQIADMYSRKKENNQLHITVETRLNDMSNRIDALHARVDALNVDILAYQNKIINDKVDHVANVVDIAVAENN
jgi:hypothetical protein